MTGLWFVRKRKHKTQTEVAQIVGKHRTTIARWERGDSLPDATSLQILAAYFAVPARELLARK